MKITSAEFLKSVYPGDKYPPGRYTEVAFAGRSNVGKSSLINTLANRKGLARISSTPGKTQSINFYLVNRSICLVDLPGYGYAKVPKQMRKRWSPLIEDYCQKRKNLRGVVIIIDARIGPTPLDLSLIQWLRDLPLPAFITITKIDKLSKNKMAQTVRQSSEVLAIPAEKICTFSAHTGQGKKELWQKLKYLIDAAHP